MAKKAAKSCGCLKNVNKQLAERGAVIVQEQLINFKTGKMRMSNPTIRVQWLDKPKRGKSLPVLICSFCPVCGTKYPE